MLLCVQSYNAGVDELLLLCCRFAQFFLSPLFNASATDREVKAVDSGVPLGTRETLLYHTTYPLPPENDRNLQEDTWRIQQVLKELSKQGHPHRKFPTGITALYLVVTLTVYFSIR